MPRTTSKSFQCSLCPKTFNRAEHAKRHEAQHNGTRAYTCDTCKKAFTRKDALSRHQAVHDGRPSLLETKSRACQACSRSKTKCSGSKPCTRCSKKNIACSFPCAGLLERRLEQGESILNPESYNNRAPPGVSPHTSTPRVDVSRVTPPIFTEGEQITPVQSTVARGPSSAGLTGHIAMQTEPTIPAMMTSQFEDMSGFDVGYWTPNTLSSINWLPIDISSLPFDDPYMPSITLEHPNFPQPSISTDDHSLEAQTPETFQSPVVPLSGTGSQQGYEGSQRTGDYYIDSDAARLTKTKRRKIIRQRDCPDIQDNYSLDVGFASPQGPRMINIPELLYCAMSESFQVSCISCAPHAVPFADVGFPSKEAFGILLDSYFYTVHQTLPCIHQHAFESKIQKASLDVQVLVIGMALLGSPFTDTPRTAQFATSMLEFGRRLLARANTPSEDVTTDTNIAQAQLLFLVGAKAASTHKASRWTKRMMWDLRAFCLLCARRLKRESVSIDTASETEWLQYVQQEEQLRTTYLVWEFDLLEYAKGDDERPCLPLSAITGLPLPGDTTWTANDAASWKSALEQTPRMTLFKALRCLYMEKRLPLGLSDFDHIILLYAVIHRTWDVKHEVSQPFSSMEPSAERESCSSTSSPATQWPPAVPLFARWRNSACDCFDILHWQANAAIGNAKGLEPPKVLHLHLARLLNLSPLASILSLSHAGSGPANEAATNKVGTQGTDEAQRDVFRWATSDQYKARLSAIHAGVIFWHVRRYSTNAFYEPFAVLAAAITLWALSIFGRKRSLVGVNGEPLTPAVDENYEIILIDRPTDDELVQQFVRSGDEMRAHMSVVSNLWDHDAPAKVLGEGKKLLSSLGAWTSETRGAINAINNLLKYKW